MRKLILCLSTLFLVYHSQSQLNLEEYYVLIDRADSLFQAKNYKEANPIYSAAFTAAGKRAETRDRLQAACSWIQEKNKDSAFSQLYILANSKKLNFLLVKIILSEDMLESLHGDQRWKGIETGLYLTAYKNLLAAQNNSYLQQVELKKRDSMFAFELANHSDSALSHVNDPAYSFLHKRMFQKAYRCFQASIENFGPNSILYQNMMDYYKAVGHKERAFIYFSRAEVVKYKRSDIISNLSLQIDSAIKSEYQNFSKAIGKKFLPPEYLITMVANSLLNKGMKEKAFSLFKMNIEFYPTSYTANKEMGKFYNIIGNKELADEYNIKSLILQYKLPTDFFRPSFNIEKYIHERQVSLTKRQDIQPSPPEPFIDDVAKQLMNKKIFDKAELLFKKNVENYPTSYYAQKSMSDYYKTTGDKAKEDEYKLKADEARTKYGTRRSRVFPNGPIVDTAFDLTVSSPVCRVNCPTILIDDLHDNATITKGWDYITLFNLFSNDGFKVIRGRTEFTKQSLAYINVVVIAGGLLDEEEFVILNNWIKDGGSLLALSHHDGRPLYNEYLKSLGVQTLEIEATQDSLHGMLRDGFTNNPAYIYFSAKDKLLGDHLIIRGRNRTESINRVQTFASSTIIGPSGSTNLLPLRKSAVDFITIDEELNSRTPVRTEGARSHGIAFNFGMGKVVVTDSWALKALVFENSERGRMGMNTPGNDNKQYALNIMRWLTGYLK